jgi:hypothetical protein
LWLRWWPTLPERLIAFGVYVRAINHHRVCRPVYLGPLTSPYVFTAPPFESVVKMRLAGVSACRDDSAGDSVDDSQRLDQQGPCSPPGFSVKAGSFQCIWFVCLGEKHQAPVIQWWRGQAADAASKSGCEAAAFATTKIQSSPAAAVAAATSDVGAIGECLSQFSCSIATETAGLPQLTAVGPM